MFLNFLITILPKFSQLFSFFSIFFPNPCHFIKEDLLQKIYKFCVMLRYLCKKCNFFFLTIFLILKESLVPTIYECLGQANVVFSKIIIMLVVLSKTFSSKNKKKFRMKNQNF